MKYLCCLLLTLVGCDDGGDATPDATRATDGGGSVPDGSGQQDASQRDSAPNSSDAALPDATPLDTSTADLSLADAAPPQRPGCGRDPAHPAGGAQVQLELGPAADGMRGFYLSRPANYDPSTPHRLIIGYPGTNWVGEQIRPYLGLEDGQRDNEIFVYPDPLWRDFEGWGNLGGWVLGPHAHPAHGDGDLAFTAALIDYIDANYCLDPARVFATGHSWGGDMAQVAACFLGDRIRAAVPVAANRPYWFEPDGPDGGWVDCVGDAAVWTLFGAGDEHFSWQSHPGEFGDECRDFWLDERGCEGADAYTDLGYGAEWECVDFNGCQVTTRYCLYDARFGHQIPDYYSRLTMEFFRGL